MRKLFFPILFLLISASLSAQLPGKAKDLLKGKAKESAPAPAPSSPASASTSPAAAVGRGGGPMNSSVDLDFSSQPFQPAVCMESLLSEACWYFNATNGELKLNNMDVSFLPKKTTLGQDVKYESYNNPTPLLRMEVVEKGTGAVKGTLYYGASESTAPFHTMEMIEKQGWPMSVKMTEGSYEMHFWAGNKQFYTYPFSVEKLANADPYAPVSTFYHLKGGWENWGYVSFGPDGHFTFNFYHSYQTTEVENAARWDKRKSYKDLVKLYRDGKMVAVHGLESNTTNFNWSDIQADNCVWKKYDHTFHAYPPPAKDRPFFLKPDMKDGNYTVEVLIKDEGGKETTYKYAFVVKDNNIVPAEQADRSKNTDNLHFLEQGRKLFFVKKTG